nr:MAG: bppU [Bacteriophage sp.]
MDNPTTIISQNVINVDIDSRAVTLPVNFNLGVMYDNSCKIITFMVKKKSDITDLTDLTFSINTISAKGTPDKLECDCREEGGFYIITALLKGTIFEASGKAVFNLCGQKFDSSHVAVKSWGSEDITALVGSHSHSEKAIEELYPSVLEELRQKVNNPNLTDEQLDDIATKIAEKGFYTKSEIDSMIAGIVVPTRLSQLADDTEHRTVTDIEKEKWNKPSVTVDTEPNANSNNPIANSAFYKAFSEVENNINALMENIITLGNWIDDKADKTALDSKVDKSSVDTALSATSTNPVQNNIITTELSKKSDKTDIPTKLAQLADDTTHRLVTDDEKKKWNALKNVNVVTEVTGENYESEDPIAVKAVVQEMLMFESLFESKEMSIFRQFELIGLDTNKLNVITKGFNDELQYTEFYFVFYGRKNNKDDTLADADGDDSISINGVKVLEVPLAYIRKRGTYFYTVGHFKLVGEFIFGTVSRCDGNGTNNTITVEPVQATNIDDIIINTSNLFKGDSKFAVYAR